MLNLNNYKNFLNKAKYDLDYISPKNKSDLNKSVTDFCNVQLDRFDNGDATGCCLNFSSYLLAKYPNTRLLTCKDNGGIHCAIVYEENNNLYVCDPAKAKIENNGKLYTQIPILEYSFDNSENQEYKIYLSLDPKTYSENSMILSIVRPRPEDILKVNNMKDLTKDQLDIISDMIKKSCNIDIYNA